MHFQVLWDIKILEWFSLSWFSCLFVIFNWNWLNINATFLSSYGIKELRWRGVSKNQENKTQKTVFLLWDVIKSECTKFLFFNIQKSFRNAYSLMTETIFLRVIIKLTYSWDCYFTYFKYTNIQRNDRLWHYKTTLNRKTTYMKIICVASQFLSFP